MYYLALGWGEGVVIEKKNTEKFNEGERHKNDYILFGPFDQINHKKQSQ